MPDRPNILVFMTDQEQAQVIRPDHPCRTPHAQRLAREGLTFGQVYCPTAHCCPSRATFMTGCYPSRHGVFNNLSNPTRLSTGLNPGIQTFSEKLRAAGYDLAYTGKWHVSDDEGPAERGFRELSVSAGKGCFHNRGMGQWSKEGANWGSERKDRKRGHVARPGWGDIRVYGSTPVPPECTDRPWEAHRDFRHIREALDELPRLAAGDKPWFLYVGTGGPHDPYIVPEPYAKMYDPKDVPLPASYKDDLADKPRIFQRMRRQFWDQLGEDEIREAIAHYWGYCSMEDDYLGLLLEGLGQTGQAENTLVIFLSDHGDYMGAHGLFAKGVPPYREAYQVPCVMRWPKGIREPGRAVEDLVSLADFAPTFAELADAEPIEPLTGRSLAPFLRSETPADWREELHVQFNGVELYYSQRQVFTKDHKYVYNGFDDDELYDLAADPHEMRNVAEDPRYAEVKRDLCRLMWCFADREGDNRLFNAYWTVAFAPWGPADALES